MRVGGGTGAKKIILYPVGDVGIQILNIMKSVYAMEPEYLIDNKKCKYSEKIHDISFLRTIHAEDYVLFLASTNPDIYQKLRANVEEFFTDDRIIELECMRAETEKLDFNEADFAVYETKIGRYSYGSLCCNSSLVESIGSFCCFADGVVYVENHEWRYVTLHPFIYAGKSFEVCEYPYEYFKTRKWYFPGVEPITENIKKQKRATIGNDVWLGRNVIVTNSANIGNGVIAAAGAVITKDVPDYAVVAGVPARIIKYRYTPEQIEALNEIKWWDWSDDKIRERYEDFYLPIEEFIKKYKK